jgi:hypothetical protein
MSTQNGATAPSSEIHFDQTPLEQELLAESTEPVTPIEHPRQVENLASEHEQAKTTEVSDRLKTGGRTNG